MKKIVWILFIGIMAGCSRELPQEPVDDSTPEIEPKQVPEVVNPGEHYQVMVSVKNADGVDSVRLDIFTSNETMLSTHYLFDDGAAAHPDDGDVVAHDDVFSQNIQFQTDVEEKDSLIWRFKAESHSGRTGKPLEVSVSAFANIAPAIVSISLPDSLPSGFDGTRTIQVTASDSNGLDDLHHVEYQAFLNDELYFTQKLSEQTNEGVYSQQVTKEFAIAKAPGMYTLKFRAVDRSKASSNVVERQFYIANTAPVLSEPSLVDSVKRPPEDMMTAFLITINVSDAQTLNDVKEVKLDWKKPDGTFSQNSPFDLYDNGLPWNEDFTGWDEGYRGDETAGDGVYSITGIFDPNQPLGLYTLTFYAFDFAGNKSDKVVRHVYLYSSEGN